MVFLIISLHAGNYRFEGVYDEPERGEGRFFLVKMFTSYNPNILTLGCGAEAPLKCAHWWPKGAIFTEVVKDHKYDFVWIESEGAELAIIQSLADVLRNTTVVYTSTHFSNQETCFTGVKFFLELAGFTLLSHWYYEGEQGNAIFVKKEIFDAAMRTLNYWPTSSNFVNYPSRYNLEPFFRKVKDKPKEHTFEPIDYIYMINLDERPEKFSMATACLAHFGIHPYRFSAVNGWKLPIASIEQIGIKFPIGTLGEKFMGTIYREIEGTQYRSNQIIQEDGETYFSMGLSQGSMGIVLSHLSVLQDAYDSGYQTIWVMEDDVEAVDDPRQMPQLIRNLDALAPDWDILFTDTDQKDDRGKYVPCRALASRPNFCMETLDAFWQRFYPIGNDFSRVGMRYGAYSMIIRRSGMEKILKYFKSYGIFLPYDMDFWLVPNIKMYRVNKDIVSHSVGAITDNSYPNYLKKNR